MECTPLFEPGQQAGLVAGAPLDQAAPELAHGVTGMLGCQPPQPLAEGRVVRRAMQVLEDGIPEARQRHADRPAVVGVVDLDLGQPAGLRRRPFLCSARPAARAATSESGVGCGSATTRRHPLRLRRRLRHDADGRAARPFAARPVALAVIRKGGASAAGVDAGVPGGRFAAQLAAAWRRTPRTPRTPPIRRNGGGG
jgi:hypothetical protein